MTTATLCLYATFPLMIGVGLTILAGTTTIGRQRQKIRVKVKKRP